MTLGVEIEEVQMISPLMIVSPDQGRMLESREERVDGRASQHAIAVLIQAPRTLAGLIRRWFVKQQLRHKLDRLSDFQLNDIGVERSTRSGISSAAGWGAPYLVPGECVYRRIGSSDGSIQNCHGASSPNDRRRSR